MQTVSEDGKERQEAREDKLMSCILGGLKEYQSRYEDLLCAYQQLNEQHEKLKRTYDDERESWKRFKQWWSEQQEAKRNAKLSTSSPLPASTPGPQPPSIFRTPAAVHVTSNASSSKLSKGDMTVLSDVGLMPRDKFVADETIETPSKSVSVSSKDERSPFGVVRSAKKQKSDSRATSSAETVNKITSSSERKPLESRTLNAEYEIDPAKNGEKSFLHKSVVRGKAKRKQMHAFDCECCKDWYDAVGPVAVRPYEEVRSPSPDAENTESDRTTIEQRKRQEHLQRTSRHRDHGPPPLTPPGYWDIGFPDTQRIVELNRTADETDRRRKELIARDPRFRRRSDIVKR